MSVRDIDTGIYHDLADWNQYIAALQKAQQEHPNVETRFGAHEFTVETVCGLSITIAGFSLEPVTCIRIGCVTCT